MKYLKRRILSERILVAILAVVIMCSISLGAAFAATSNGDTFDRGLTVIFNGSVLRMEDDDGNKLEPIMVDGKMYLPADGVANLLGVQHQEIEDENISVWYDTSAKAILDSTKEGLKAGYRLKASSNSLYMCFEHRVDQLVSMLAIEEATAFNKMWINIPEGRTGYMTIIVANTGMKRVRETPNGKVVSTNSNVVHVAFEDDGKIEGIRQAAENDQEEEENEWNGMPLTVKVYNDETDELLSESRLEKGHQVDFPSVKVDGVKTLRIEADPDIESWKAAQAESTANEDLEAGK